MSDAGLPHGGEEPEAPETVDEPTGDPEELVIITGGTADSEPDGDEPMGDDVAPEDVEEAERAAEFTLDELVAEMAGVSAVAASASAGETAPVQGHVDPLTAAMSEVFAEAAPIESEMWTRAPFWAVGASWVVFIGVLTFLLWPRSTGGLETMPLYGVLVFGGAVLVVVSLMAGLVVWARARARTEPTDRPVVSRALLLRMLGWTAAGVALWVIAMVVLSLHHLDVL